MEENRTQATHLFLSLDSLLNAGFVIRNVFPLQVIIFQQLPNLIFCILKNPILAINRINAQVRNFIFRRLTNRNIGNHDGQKKKSRFYSLSLQNFLPYLIRHS